MTNEETVINELLDLNEQLLDSIAEGDWETYQKLCDPTLTAFEPESRGSLAEGMDFHRFYFDRGGIRGGYNITVCSPHVRLMGDVAVISYVRLLQMSDDAGKPATYRSEETRIWQRQDALWRHVHFHRSCQG
jgi:calcium/calmodulin-dependent protein kinase (CaM kinase) II